MFLEQALGYLKTLTYPSIAVKAVPHTSTVQIQELTSDEENFEVEVVSRAPCELASAPAETMVPSHIEETAVSAYYGDLTLETGMVPFAFNP